MGEVCNKGIATSSWKLLVTTYSVTRKSGTTSDALVTTSDALVTTSDVGKRTLPLSLKAKV